MAHAEEVGQRALDLENGGMGRMGVEGCDRDRIGSLGDDLEEMLREELTVQRVGAMIDEVFGG